MTETNLDETLTRELDAANARIVQLEAQLALLNQIANRERIARIADQILDGVHLAHGQRPSSVPSNVWTKAAEEAWQDGLFLVELATALEPKRAPEP